MRQSSRQHRIAQALPGLTQPRQRIGAQEVHDLDSSAFVMRFVTSSVEATASIIAMRCGSARALDR